MIRTTACAALLLGGIAACDAAETPPAAAPEATASAADAAAAPDGTDMAQSDDALVPGTQYNATTILDCSFDGTAVTEGCNAGVMRNSGEAGMHMVEVTKPDGMKRVIFYEGTTPTGADGSEADGSSDWDFEVTRDGDTVTVVFGPETYTIPDAVITGG